MKRRIRKKVDKPRDECYQAIKVSKENDLKSLGNKLVNKTTGPKAYWKIINNLLNKCKIPEHFFLHCARFTEARYTFLNTIHLLNRNFLLLVPEEKSLFILYGDKSLAHDTNKLVLKATLKYLKYTERFA